MITEETIWAFQRLRESGKVELDGDIEGVGRGDAKFKCRLPVPQPNSEGFPDRVEFEVGVPATYPEGEIAFYPLTDGIAGFPHQSFQVERRKLCLLKSESEYPWDPNERLTAVVESAIEWVGDAARGELFKIGQDWELPDFRIPQITNAPTLLFREDSSSLAVWQNKVGQAGKVELAFHKLGSALFATKFNHGNDSLFSPKLEDGFITPSRSYSAEWIMLPSLIFERHRPPKTFGELEQLCLKDCIDLWCSLNRLSKTPSVPGISTSTGNFHFLVLGFPIPKKVGGDSIEIHWQPITIPHNVMKEARRENTTRRGQSSNADQFAKGRLQEKLKSQLIPWGTSKNIGGERLSVRGMLAKETRTKNISLVGFGAVGSVVAEHLARGGVHSLAIFDRDKFGFENLVRHTLGPKEIGLEKALAFAKRMEGLYPDTKVAGFKETFPQPFSGLKTDSKSALESSDIWIDCSANASTFRWLSKSGKERGKMVLHIYINVHARFLTILRSGTEIDCIALEKRFLDDIAEGRTPFSKKEYTPEAGPELMPGAGCWHPTFPGNGHDIAALMSASVPILENLLSGRNAAYGAAVVLKREEFADPLFSGSLVKVEWNRDYK